MALPKNKSRKISVAGNEFRYVISISWKENGNFYFNITIQSEIHNGSKLLLKGLVTRDFWLDFSDFVVENVDMNEYPTITPKHIAHFIMSATENGWDFSTNGKDFVLEVKNEDLTSGSKRRDDRALES